MGWLHISNNISFYITKINKGIVWIGKSFLDIIKPLSLSGTRPIVVKELDINITEQYAFEIKMMFDFLFYGYMCFGISSHFFDPVYVWHWFYQYVFGVIYFWGLTLTFNFLVPHWKKKIKEWKEKRKV